MKFKTSCFNRTLIRKHLTGNWPLWALYLVALILLYPIGAGQSIYRNSEETQYGLSLLLSTTLIGGGLYTMIFAFLAAYFCFRFLNDARSSYMMHAFPVSRAELYGSGVFSGLLMGLVPFWLVYLTMFTLPLPTAQVFKAGLLYTQMYLFFYGTAVLSMMITAQSLAASALYAFLNFGAIVLEILLMELVEPLLYGIDYSGAEYLMPLSPIVELWSQMVNSETAGTVLRELTGSYALIISIVGLIFIAVGYEVCYSLRPAETAGEITAHRATRPVFKYLVTSVASLGLGELFCAIVTGDCDIRETPVELIFCLLAAAFIGFFGAEMLLKKSLQVFTRKAALGLTVFCMLLLGILALVWLDIPGFVRRVPEPETVETLEVNVDAIGGENFVITDENTIAELCAVHTGVTEDRNQVDYACGTGEEGYWETLMFSYTLKNGKTISRLYRLDSTSAAAETYREILNRPENVRTYLNTVLNSAAKLELCALYETGDGYESCEWETRTVPELWREGLIQAVLQDAGEGNFRLSGSYEEGAAELSLKDGKNLFEIGLIIIPWTAEHTLTYLEKMGMTPADCGVR